MKNLKIIFMGTPEFAVESLKELITNKYNVVAVITAPDKPAGRGQKMQATAVKIFAEEKGLPVLQPVKLKDEAFLEELRSYNADLQIVVAFRMLPEVVWNMPKLGTFNLHASLLPQYRGAAPINWAVINGEKESGATTFFLDKEIDTGKIILQEKVDIKESDTAGDLHDKLMYMGAKLVCKTVDSIEQGAYEAVDQSQYFTSENELKPAPKIQKTDCKINWDDTAENIYNFIRGFAPYPAAWTIIKTDDGKEFNTKIFFAEKTNSEKQLTIGEIETDNKTYINVGTKKGILSIKQLQIAGKKRMPVNIFLSGSNINNNWCFS